VKTKLRFDAFIPLRRIRQTNHIHKDQQQKQIGIRVPPFFCLFQLSLGLEAHGFELSII
jgi:hypothetical protein